MAEYDLPKVDSNTAEIVVEPGRHVGFVVEQLLCTGCATCDAACPDDAISMEYSPGSGVFEPRIDSGSCSLCGICVAVCPGFRLDTRQWRSQRQVSNHHQLIGPYQSIWRAYSSDESVRSGAASGGAITEIIRHLFKSRRIDGAIVTRMNPNAPLQAEAVIVDSEQALLATQKSKYCPHPHNSILKYVLRNRQDQKRLAFVGLPSHVHGLRNLQRLIPGMDQTIPYVLSLFTAHVPSREATEFLLLLNEINADDVESIDYRSDGVPGFLRIKRRDGGETTIPHQHWSYWGHAFSHFFYPPREWLYFDKLSQWADWSVGDNWQLMNSDRQGASTVVCRNTEADVVIEEMRIASSLITQPMTDSELVHDQDLENKLNIGIRLKVWQWLGGNVPDYHPQLPIRWRDTAKTVRFALYVRLCMLTPPVWVLATLIRSDYLLRKRLPRACRKALRPVRRLGRAALRAIRILPARDVGMDAPPKILMIGGYGWKDIGDESMPHADLIKLRACLPSDIRIVMASVDPAGTATRYGEQTVSDLLELQRVGNRSLQLLRWSAIAGLFLFGASLQKLGWRLALWPEARAYLDELANSSLLFNVGGGNLNSLTRGELYKKSVSYIAARILGVPVVVSGQTIGPFTRRSDLLLARLGLNQVRMITFRDKEESRVTTRSIGVSRPVLRDAADDAITLPSITREQALALLHEETSIDFNQQRPELLVLLNCKASLSLFKQAGRANDLVVETHVLLQIAERLLAIEGVTVIFVATDFTHTVDDRVVHREVHRRLTNTSRAFILEREYTDQELKGIISLADLALGMRYHFHVFAAAECVPFLGFASGEYQMRKLRGLANLLSEPACYFVHDIEQADFEDLWRAVLHVLETRYQIAERLKGSVPVLARASHLSIEMAHTILTGAAKGT